jgi:hypothetical protein
LVIRVARVGLRLITPAVSWSVPLSVADRSRQISAEVGGSSPRRLWDPAISALMAVPRAIHTANHAHMRSCALTRMPTSEVLRTPPRQPAASRTHPSFCRSRRSSRPSPPRRCARNISYLSCSIPTQFFAGSMNQAIHAKPMSAMPSTVFKPGKSYSSIFTPFERR